MKLKKRLIDAGILVVVFIIAVIVFSLLTNQGNDNMTADMSAATFPQVSFSYNGYNLNTLPGYAQEMDIASMRDTITPVVGNQLNMNISAYKNVIQSLKYQVYTLDGTQLLKEETVDSPGETVTLNLDATNTGGLVLNGTSDNASDEDNEEEGLLSEERVLQIALTTEEGSSIYFYTRIADASDTNVLDCLDYVNDFHEKAINKEGSDEIGAVLEPNEESDNSSYQHVDIHSSYEQVSWGELEPAIENGMRWKIKELNANYTSVLLEYQVRCKGEENETDLYNVKEFFRVRYIGSGSQAYLLDYDREMEQVFDASGKILSESGILLGITDSDVQYMVNKDGSIVSFVEAGELWNYNKNADQMSLLFSFSDAEATDVRNLNPMHEIEILNMDKKGNTTFAVYGYMNRGEHEGEVGVAVYYYDIEKNSIQERVFISSTRSYEYVEKELGKLVYYSDDQEMLYAMVDGTLYEYNVSFDEKKVQIEGLSDGQYVVSDDGSMVAYQSNGDANTATELIVLDLESGEEQKIACLEDECIRPLGFMKEDFVYGIARTSDIGKTAAGESIIPMYKVEIAGSDGEVEKTYQVDGTYVIRAEFADNMITLSRVSKKDDTYTATTADYITNNEEKKESNIYLESYVTDLKETQMRLAYGDGVSDKSPKLLKPKYVLYETMSTVSFDESAGENRYYVYAHGGMQGIYDKAADAISAANTYSGVVVASDQNYIWERGNRDLEYSIDADDSLVEKLRSLLADQKSPVDAIGSLNDGNVLDLTGCEVEELLYIINQGQPVIAMKDAQKSILLVGYTEETVTYVDVETGSRESVDYDTLEEMTADSGNTYIGFGR
jgi:hypothetical protein